MKNKTYGSIEGRLNDEDGYYNYFIASSFSSQFIPCIFTTSEVPPIGKRVSVWGRIAYDTAGKPTSIIVENYRVFPPQSELPTFEDVRGILKGKEDENSGT